jgi:predicted phage terminase large subunit-like protein
MAMTQTTDEAFDWGDLRSIVHGPTPMAAFGLWGCLNDEQQRYVLDALPDRNASLAELGRRFFRIFVALMKPQYDLEWFHEVICEEIQKWADAKDPYTLLFSMPPGHGKSEYAKLASAWLIARDLDNRIAYASYAQQFADDQGADVQAIVDSQEFRHLFGHLINSRRAVTDETRGAKRTAGYFEVIGGDGSFKTVGRGGGLTGKRLDIGIVDDILKDDQEAYSQTIRDQSYRWYNRVLGTRKRPKRPYRRLILATRWHLDDLSGRIKSSGVPYVELRFEALREDMSDPRDPRAYGEALWSDVETQESLERIREQDPEGFAALYQQNPVIAGGNIIRDDWIQTYMHLPDCPGTWYQSCDPKHGSRDPASSDFVNQLWFQPDDWPGRLYLVNEVRGVLGTTESLDAWDQCQVMEVWNRTSVRFIEEKGDGVTIIDMRRDQVPGIIGVQPSGTKELRLRRVAAYYRAGNIYYPDESIAPWIRAHRAQVLNFPMDAKDDMVDAETQIIEQVLFPVDRDDTLTAEQILELQSQY